MSGEVTMRFLSLRHLSKREATELVQSGRPEITRKHIRLKQLQPFNTHGEIPSKPSCENQI